MMDCRRDWLSRMLQIEGNVLDCLAAGKLKKKLPLGFHPDRADFAPLEAFGRCMLGLAPWLEADASALDDEERALQAAWREKALRCIAMAVDPASPDYMNFTTGGQPLVDAAFLAHALVRAPKELAGALPERTRRLLAEAFRASRGIAAANCNWLFFSAMVEAGLYVLGEPWDMMRVLYALRTFQGWYLGDGVYGDGPCFHWDYYNSFVIQPMYVDLVNLLAGEREEIAAMQPAVNAHAKRYAAILERMIGPEGSYPVAGRSICYRFGAFQMLAQAALEHMLPAHLTPAGVRCGLTSVIHRVMSAPDMFDGDGWLMPGVYGHQPELAEGYINIGSLYLCTAVFLPLGLSPADPFWADPDDDWTGRRV
ncbi:MAG: DUF2264 domain-containing protein, partial [Aristaeellaceae bacterium]